MFGHDPYRKMFTKLKWTQNQTKNQPPPLLTWLRIFSACSHEGKMNEMKWKSLSCSDSLWPYGLVHGILQDRILEWVAFPTFSRGSSQPRDRTRVSRIAGGFSTSWATREAPYVRERTSKKRYPAGLSSLVWSNSLSPGKQHKTIWAMMKPSEYSCSWIPLGTWLPTQRPSLDPALSRRVLQSPSKSMIWTWRHIKKVAVHKLNQPVVPWSCTSQPMELWQS